tara:strand:+ start:201 stop:1196 length:996 start_codon:yes stop_codon:yes gene_type:complete
MFNEDTETVEAVDTGDSTEAVAPVETTDTASVEVAAEPAETVEPVEVADTTATAETSVDAADTVIDWNGEIDSLKKDEWFLALDDKLQGAVLEGLNTKYSNWQRGYTDKFQEMGLRRKALDAKEADVRDQEQRVQKWLHGDIDPLEEKQKEIDELKAMHRSAIDTLKGEFADATEKASNSSKSELQQIIQERETLRQQIESFETKAKEAEEAEIAHAVQEFETWIKDTSPSVHENDAAFKLLCELCTANVDPREAMDMVNYKFKFGDYAPKEEVEVAPEPEPIPEAIDMMSMGTNASGTQAAEARDFASIMKNLRNQAQADYEARLQSSDK